MTNPEMYLPPSSSDLRLELAETRRRLEMETAARHRAEEALRNRDELIAVIAHDLRNPLSAIVTSTAILDRLPPPVDARWRPCVGNIRRACDRMRRLLCGLLDASDIEAGTFSVVPTACDAGRLLSEIVQLLEVVAAEKGLELATAPMSALTVRCDRERVMQVLENLIGNAIKFTEQGRVLVLARHDGNAVRFSVLDDGPGIADEDRDRVFEKFWRKKTRGPGIGLGLAIAKGIVAAHGGRIWVESEPGRGCAFHFTIPA